MCKLSVDDENNATKSKNLKSWTHDMPKVEVNRFNNEFVDSVPDVDVDH